MADYMFHFVIFFQEFLTSIFSKIRINTDFLEKLEEEFWNKFVKKED